MITGDNFADMSGHLLVFVIVFFFFHVHLSKTFTNFYQRFMINFVKVTVTISYIALIWVFFVFFAVAKLGANAILGVSLAVCKAGAAHKVSNNSKYLLIFYKAVAEKT